MRPDVRFLVFFSTAANNSWPPNVRTQPPCSKSVGSFGRGYVSGAAQRAVPCRPVAAEHAPFGRSSPAFVPNGGLQLLHRGRPTCGRIALAPKVSVPLAAATCPGLPNVRFPVVQWLLNIVSYATRRAVSCIFSTAANNSKFVFIDLCIRGMSPQTSMR